MAATLALDTLQFSTDLSLPSPVWDQKPIATEQSNLCQNFECCGIQLESLQDLMKHYDECHVAIAQEDRLQSYEPNDELQEKSQEWSGNHVTLQEDNMAMNISSIERKMSVINFGTSTPDSNTNSKSQKRERLPSFSFPPKKTRPDDNSPSNFLLSMNTQLQTADSISNYAPFGFMNPSIDMFQNNTNFFYQPPQHQPSMSHEQEHQQQQQKQEQEQVQHGIQQKKTSHGYDEPLHLQAPVPSHSALHQQSRIQAMHASFLPTRSLTPSTFESMIDSQFRTATPPPRPFSVPIMSQQEPSPLESFRQQEKSSLSHSPFTSPSLSPSISSSIGGQPVGSFSLDDEYTLGCESRKYKCTKAGCTKIYKNANGLKYHMDHGNCEMDFLSPELQLDANMQLDPDMKIAKRPYWCKVVNCGRKYKNLNGLKYHAAHAHPEFDLKTLCKGSRVVVDNAIPPKMVP